MTRISFVKKVFKKTLELLPQYLQNYWIYYYHEVIVVTQEKKDKTIVIGICLTILAIFIGISWYIGAPLVDLAKDPKGFRLFLDNQGIFSRIYMMGIVFLQIVIAFIPGEIFEIGAGYAFGFWEGTALCLLGSMVASGVVMWLVRKYGTRLVYVFFSKEKIEGIKFLQDPKKLNMWVFIAFFIPGTPKDVMTYMIGLTNMKISTFMMISTIARIPSVITSTFSGNALGSEDYMLAIISFVFTIIISALGLWVYTAYVNNKHQERKNVEILPSK